MKQIIPAILTNNVLDLENKLKEIQGLADWVHIDILDGKFVNNTSVRIEAVSQIDTIKHFLIEAHLMIKNPEEYFPMCRRAKAERVIFHIEATDNVEETLLEAKRYSFLRGLALNPETKIEKVQPYVADLECILLMSVVPGFQGQQFIFSVLDKIRSIKSMAPEVKVGVDGGINLDNIKAVHDAGADYVVIGSGLLGSQNIKERFNELQSKIT